LDRRIKYYGIQGGAAALSGLILLVALLSSSGWALWCLALPLCVGIGGGGWWLSRRFGAETSRHLTPQEWAELRGALEDLPVLSVLHLFGQDRTRLERFRYLPLLKQSLWEALAEDQVDVGRVVRIAFLLHAFRQDLREYSEVIPAVPDTCDLPSIGSAVAHTSPAAASPQTPPARQDAPSPHAAGADHSRHPAASAAHTCCPAATHRPALKHPASSHAAAPKLNATSTDSTPASNVSTTR
jgi:hypothetical protein